MNILIAEDDVTSRALLAGVLKNRGHSVIETVNGHDAWQVLQQPDAPRLVILDWMMPGMDGPELLRRVRALPSDRPPYVIMLTAKTDKHDIIAGLAAGANDYLCKPFDSGELFARVEAGERMVGMQEALADKAEMLRRAREDLRVLAGRLQVIREEERAALSRELHDSFGPLLTALQIDLLRMDRQLRAGEPPVLAVLADRIAAMVPVVERLTEQTQAISASLRPNVLFELGLMAAMDWLADETAKRGGLECHMVLPAEEIELGGDLSLELFRMVQESLTNVVRHARATRVDVSLEQIDGHLQLLVRDDGRGFPAGTVAGPHALGLLGMCERVAALGGAIRFENAADGGARVAIRVPVQAPRGAVTAPPFLS